MAIQCYGTRADEPMDRFFWSYLLGKDAESLFCSSRSYEYKGVVRYGDEQNRVHKLQVLVESFVV